MDSLQTPEVLVWSPVVERWLLDAAELYATQANPLEVWMGVFLIAPDPWAARMVAEATPELVNAANRFVGRAIGTAPLKVSSDGDGRESFAPAEDFPAALERWRDRSTERELLRIADDLGLGEVIRTAAHLGGQHVSPWPFLYLLLHMLGDSRNAERVLAAPLVLQTRRASIQIQRWLRHEQLRKLAGTRPLVYMVEQELIPAYGIDEDALVPLPASSGLEARRLADGPGLVLLERRPPSFAFFANVERALNSPEPGLFVYDLTGAQARHVVRDEAEVDQSIRSLRDLAESGYEVVFNRLPDEGLPPGQKESPLEGLPPEADDALWFFADLLMRQGATPEAQPSLADRARGQMDLLDQERVAHAMAHLACMKETKTPLCFGVFGEWGSGKSFLMSKMDEEIAAGNPHAPRLKGGLYENVARVNFNAWTYAKSDLWSSLLLRLLVELENWKLRDTRKGKQAVHDAEEKVEQSRLQIATLDRQIDQLRVELETAGEGPAERALRESMQERVNGLGEVAAKRREDLRSWPQLVFAEVVEALAGRSSKGKVFAARFGVLMLVALLAVLTGPTEWFQGATRYLAGWVTGLGGFLTLATTALQAWKKQVDPLKAQYEAAEKALEEAQAEFQRIFRRDRDRTDKDAGKDGSATATATTAGAAGQAQQTLEDKQRAMARLLEERDAARQTLEGRRRELLDTRGKIEVLPPERDLEQFLAERLAEGDYQSRVGRMQRVESDLRELAASFLTASDGRAPERLILFIDDLDRCPPTQVVAILEAIQLLLADNPSLPPGTPNPFVVVLGVDTRILTRALETEYRGILSRRERPSGLDYVEKVIQIPYWIPPVEKAGYERYLEGLTGVQMPAQERVHVDEGFVPRIAASVATREAAANVAGDADSGNGDVPRAFELSLVAAELVTAEDLQWFMRFQPIAPGNPRALKRLVNQYRLCKAIAMARPGQEFDSRCSIFLLCLADGFRASARVLVRVFANPELNPRMRAEGEAQDPDPGQGATPREERTLAELFEDLYENGASLRPSLRAEFLVLSHTLKRLDKDGHVPSLGDLCEAEDDVIPFCFVGDVSQKAGQDIGNVEVERLLQAEVESVEGDGAGDRPENETAPGEGDEAAQVVAPGDAGDADSGEDGSPLLEDAPA